jgi:hypothetical protein
VPSLAVRNEHTHHVLVGPVALHPDLVQELDEAGRFPLIRSSNTRPQVPFSSSIGPWAAICPLSMTIT